jgi:hypothetical protein
MNNKDDISRVIVSLDLLEKFKTAAKWVELTSVEDKDTEIENWFLYGVPFKMSNVMKRGCVLEMKSGEFIVLNKI